MPKSASSNLTDFARRRRIIRFSIWNSSPHSQTRFCSTPTLQPRCQGDRESYHRDSKLGRMNESWQTARVQLLLRYHSSTMLLSERDKGRLSPLPPLSLELVNQSFVSHQGNWTIKFQDFHFFVNSRERKKRKRKGRLILATEEDTIEAGLEPGLITVTNKVSSVREGAVSENRVKCTMVSSRLTRWENPTRPVLCLRRATRAPCRPITVSLYHFQMKNLKMKTVNPSLVCLGKNEGNRAEWEGGGGENAYRSPFRRYRFRDRTWFPYRCVRWFRIQSYQSPRSSFSSTRTPWPSNHVRGSPRPWVHGSWRERRSSRYDGYRKFGRCNEPLRWREFDRSIVREPWRHE